MVMVNVVVMVDLVVMVVVVACGVCVVGGGGADCANSMCKHGPQLVAQHSEWVNDGLTRLRNVSSMAMQLRQRGDVRLKRMGKRQF